MATSERITYLTQLLVNIRAAILALSQETAVSVNLAGTSYTLAKIQDLYDLETRTHSDLDAALSGRGRPRFRAARIGGH